MKHLYPFHQPWLSCIHVGPSARFAPNLGANVELQIIALSSRWSSLEGDILLGWLLSCLTVHKRNVITSFQMFSWSDHADKFRYGVVRQFVGHGVGQVFHADPVILHYSKFPGLKCGCFCIGSWVHSMFASLFVLSVVLFGIIAYLFFVPPRTNCNLEKI